MQVVCLMGLQAPVSFKVLRSALSICWVVPGLWSEVSLVCHWSVCQSAGIFLPTCYWCCTGLSCFSVLLGSHCGLLYLLLHSSSPLCEFHCTLSRLLPLLLRSSVIQGCLLVCSYLHPLWSGGCTPLHVVCGLPACNLFSHTSPNLLGLFPLCF